MSPEILLDLLTTEEFCVFLLADGGDLMGILDFIVDLAFEAGETAFLSLSKSNSFRISSSFRLLENFLVGEVVRTFLAVTAKVFNWIKILCIWWMHIKLSSKLADEDAYHTVQVKLCVHCIILSIINSLPSLSLQSSHHLGAHPHKDPDHRLQNSNLWTGIILVLK